MLMFSRFVHSNKNDSTWPITQTPSVVNPCTQLHSQRGDLTDADCIKGRQLMENMGAFSQQDGLISVSKYTDRLCKYYLEIQD